MLPITFAGCSEKLPTTINYEEEWPEAQSAEFLSAYVLIIKHIGKHPFHKIKKKDQTVLFPIITFHNYDMI